MGKLVFAFRVTLHLQIISRNSLQPLRGCCEIQLAWPNFPMPQCATTLLAAWCIAAREAQSTDRVVLSSAVSALSVTLHNGKTSINLQDPPAGPDYQQQFITTVPGLLRNTARLAQLPDAAMRH